MEKIHYQEKNSTIVACGRAGLSPVVTHEADEVTCKACIRIIFCIKSGGTPKRKDGRNKVGIVLSDRAYEKYKTINDKSKTISDFLESI